MIIRDNKGYEQNSKYLKENYYDQADMATVREIENTPKQIDDLNLQLPGLQSQLAQLNVKLSLLNTQSTELNGQLSQLDAQDPNNEDAIISLNTQIEEIDGQISVVDNQMYALNSQVNALDSQINDLNATLPVLQDQLKAIRQASTDYVVDETTDEGKSLAAKIMQSYPYYDFVEDAEGMLTDVTPWPEISYLLDKLIPILLGEVVTITAGVSPLTVTIDGQDYDCLDGIVEYSNQNPGTYEIVLKADGYRPTTVEVVVNAA